MAYTEKVLEHYQSPKNVGSFAKNEENVGTGIVGAPECGDVMKLQLKINPETEVIEDARFKTFGCGSAIASSSYVTELVKGKTVTEAYQIKNTKIVQELSLPPTRAKGEDILLGDAVVLTRLDKAIGWARKYSIFPYPFATACCAMEYMSLSMAPYDIDRFGAALPRFTPRQADLLMVIGTVTIRQAPILRRVYDQMAEPKWVMSFGACASSGGFYDNYTTLPGIDRVIPVDVYVPGCPPRPEAVLDGLMMLQKRIQNERQRAFRREV